MNNQMFFYPPYLYEQSGINQNYSYNERGSSDLFTPEETLINGNIFKKEYKPYKKYAPKHISASNEKEKQLLKMMEYFNMYHDLKLYLILHPTDKIALTNYYKYLAEFEASRALYEKENRLYPYNVRKDDEKYYYAITSSPWVK